MLILYIEDNPQNMRLVRKMLKSGGYEILEAPDGVSGLKMAEQQRPDLILMDINLPDIDGMQITKRIKENPELTHIPIIALTANAMVGDKETFINGGCDGYLAKPVSRRELCSTVASYLSDKQELATSA